MGRHRANAVSRPWGSATSRSLPAYVLAVTLFVAALALAVLTPSGETLEQPVVTPVPPVERLPLAPPGEGDGDTTAPDPLEDDPLFDCHLHGDRFCGDPGSSADVDPFAAPAESGLI